METCKICGDALDDGRPITQLREKGSDTFNRISVLKKDKLITSPGQKLHQCCRRDYVNAKTLAFSNKSVETNVQTLRSKTPAFNFKENCLFCGRIAKIDDRKRGHDVFPVRTTDFQNSVLTVCEKRNDEWSNKIVNRLETALADLPAADAVYHQKCSVNFRTGRQIPSDHYFDSNGKVTPGRPKKKTSSDSGRPKRSEDAFLQVIKQLEDSEVDQISITDLVKNMELLCGEDAFSTVHMKSRVLDHFGSNITVTDVNGKNSVLTFTRTLSTLLQTFYNRPKQDPDQEKRSIVQMAAKLIKAEIRSMEKTKINFPNPDEISSTDKNLDYLPPPLKIFLKEICNFTDANNKIAAIGQALVQAARPRTLVAPLQLALGVQMHHHFGSRFLIDVLNNLGFSVSYSEVQKYELNAAAVQENSTTIPEGSFIQYIADNVDHNVGTLDGHGTFHGMGIIAAITPSIVRKRNVARENPSLQEIANIAKINIVDYARLPGSLVFDVLKEMEVQDATSKIDLLSAVSWPLRSISPSWSAIMHKTMEGGTYPGKSSIQFLPIIDMNPSDLTCINSTLHFVCKEANNHGRTPIITFDQPLYWKAATIIANEPQSSPLKCMVLKLGGFHTEMSYAGSIGHLMAGSGLTELLETIYAANSVSHMLSGKAISRAVRGHLLIDRAITAVLIEQVYGVPIPTSEISDEPPVEDNTFLEDLCEQRNTEVQHAAKVLDDLLLGNVTVTDVCNDDILDKIQTKLDDFRNIHANHRTAQLWFMYHDMVKVLQKFIKAERTGDWLLHLQTVRAMLPYLAASGHNLYVKSARIYLQQMDRLETENPEVYAFLQSGYGVIRRSDKYWSGISSDLAIEQVLMRSIKATGGLTRGRGMAEMQRALWILSMPDCAQINEAMQEFTCVNFNTSGQHKEDGETRRKRDSRDASILSTFLSERNPFIGDKSLRNIETGVTAETTVNVDKAKELGQQILKSMDNQKADEYSFKKKQQAVTLNDKSSLKIEGESITVDPQLLFQRFIAAADGTCDDQYDLFTYELCSLPSSMFDSSGLMRMSQKSTLGDYIWNIGDCCGSELKTDNVKYVLDGGSLLHRIHWISGQTFQDICQRYVDYIRYRYKDTVVVFDGYCSGPSTKDAIHLRRTKGIIGTKVSFTMNTPFRSKKDAFLANNDNKQNFLNMLSSKLNEHGIETTHAAADADVLIARTAIASARTKTTILLGEDTDLLVLLLHSAEPLNNNIFFMSDIKGNSKIKVWDISKTKHVLGIETCKVLPVIHAISGCDTTSRLFGVGKGVAMKKLSASENILSSATVFLSNKSTTEEVIIAGEHLISTLYGGIGFEGLDTLRYRKFTSRVLSNKTFLQVHTLPPTSVAAAFHSMRCYLQVQTWTSEEDCDELDACVWGWTRVNSRLMPITTNRAPAPEKLMLVIRCKCKTSCDTRRCTCRKHGLECSVVCGDCKGNSCSNSPSLDIIDS